MAMYLKRFVKQLNKRLIFALLDQLITQQGTATFQMQNQLVVNMPKVQIVVQKQTMTTFGNKK